MKEIISEKYISGEGWVTIPAGECLLIEHCQLHYDQIIAVFKDGNRLLLLGDCGLGNDDKGTRDIKNLKTTAEVYCSLEYISELHYNSIEEAISDIKYHKILKREIREIDSIAYNNWCNINR